MLADEMETKLVKMDDYELILFLMNEKYIHSEVFCDFCAHSMKLVKYAKVNDKWCWRCVYNNCEKAQCRKSVRSNSFFENLNLPFLMIFKIIFRWVTDVSQHSIEEGMGVRRNTVLLIKRRILKRIEERMQENEKLGGPGKIVQIDETMLNYKCKSHRGRSAENRTDALCMVEINENGSKAFACVIPDKKASTILPIIIANVKAGTTIHTDEHLSYKKLNQIGFNHSTVCHKYEFVDKETGVHTQVIESFHNCLKLCIKKRKGVLTELRSEFLNEFVWFWNNKGEKLQNILNLIKF